MCSAFCNVCGAVGACEGPLWLRPIWWPIRAVPGAGLVLPEGGHPAHHQPGRPQLVAGLQGWRRGQPAASRPRARYTKQTIRTHTYSLCGCVYIYTYHIEIECEHRTQGLNPLATQKCCNSHLLALHMLVSVLLFIHLSVLAWQGRASSSKEKPWSKP